MNQTTDAAWMWKETSSSLRRLLPRIEARYKNQTDPAQWDTYVQRLKRHFSRLFERLHALYGDDYDFFYYLEGIIASATEMWLVRPEELKALDAMREADPDWYLSHRMVGATCYVNLFGDDLKRFRERIPYLSELGITYLHLMPLFKVPSGDNDGGYAVSSFREVNPALGTMEDLAGLATELRHHGISLVLDFVFNHIYTSRFPGSFARGAPFQEDLKTGDARVSGTCASLVGLEQALEKNDSAAVDFAMRRLLMIHGIIMTIGGIPLIYLGDEIGMLNDYAYDHDPAKIGDSRWLHRSRFDRDRARLRRDSATEVGRIFQGMLRLVQLRQQNLAFTRAETEIADTGNPHVFGYFRNHDQHSVLVLANFSENEQRLEARKLRLMGMRKTMVDLFNGRTITAAQELVMASYDFLVLSRSAA